MTPAQMKATRTALGMSQLAFADTFGLVLDTYKEWEQGHKRPSGAALVLLHLIASDPNTVARVVAQLRREAP